MYLLTALQLQNPSHYFHQQAVAKSDSIVVFMYCRVCV